MVYIVVPRKVYNRVASNIPTPMWAWVDVRVGRGYAVEADPWEAKERILTARNLLALLRPTPAKK